MATLEKIIYNQDTGTEAIQKLDRNQRKINDETGLASKLATERGYITVPIIETGSANTMVDSGCYLVRTAVTDTPYSYQWWLEVHSIASKTWVMQTATQDVGASPKRYFRTCVSNTWSKWQQIIIEDDLTTYKVVPRFCGGVGGDEGGEIQFAAPPNGQISPVTLDIYSTAARFYATQNGVIKIASIDFNTMSPNESVVVTQALRSGIQFTNGWTGNGTMVFMGKYLFLCFEASNPAAINGGAICTLVNATCTAGFVQNTHYQDINWTFTPCNVSGTPDGILWWGGDVAVQRVNVTMIVPIEFR